jgi:hypothetical protein
MLYFKDSEITILSEVNFQRMDFCVNGARSFVICDLSALHEVLDGRGESSFIDPFATTPACGSAFA